MPNHPMTPAELRAAAAGLRASGDAHSRDSQYADSAQVRGGDLDRAARCWADAADLEALAEQLEAAAADLKAAAQSPAALPVEAAPDPKAAAQIKAIKAQTRREGIDEDTHRAMVRRVSRGRSERVRDLTGPERQMLLRELGGKDGGPRRARTPTPSRAGDPSAAAMDRTQMLKRAEELIRQQDLPWSYAEAILRRQRGLDPTPPGAVPVACPLGAATEPELRGVIAALYRRANPSAPRRGGAA